MIELPKRAFEVHLRHSDSDNRDWMKEHVGTITVDKVEAGS